MRSAEVSTDAVYTVPAVGERIGSVAIVDLGIKAATIAALAERGLDVHVVPEDADWVLEVEGAGDLTMERLASLARADYLTEVFGRKVSFREGRARQWS